jgi:(p)ppGpp synthase/HD superfamily hydrolase
MKISALLHDTLEDTDATENEIENLFGKDVLALVKELTNEKIPNLNRESRKKLDRVRLATVSKSAKILKLIDRIDNLKDLNDCPDGAFKKLYFAESKLLLNQALSGTNAKLERKLRKILDEETL